jgi:hypothetical protein
MYGQTYVKVAVESRIDKMRTLEIDITRNGKKVGRCIVYLYAEGSVCVW